MILQKDIILEIKQEDMQIFSIYEIQLDFRHISEYNNKFRYGREWTFFLEFENQNMKQIIPLYKIYPEPTGYYTSSLIPFQFRFQPQQQGKLTISIERENELFMNQSLSFSNMVTYEILNRINKKNFISLITKELEVNFPNNIFHIKGYEQFPPFVISSNANYDILHKYRKIQSKQYLQDSILFQKEEKYFAMSYLPFFMHCENFGDYLYIQDLFENQKYCDLKQKDQIIPISNFNFGQSPQADECQVNVKCFYEYDLNTINASNNDKWFLANVKQILFQFYTYPVDEQEFAKVQGNQDIDFENLVDVTVESVKETNKIPSVITLNIGYFQKGLNNKQLITADIMFSGYLEPDVVKNYSLNVNIQPLNHAQLTIAFAFDWYLYLLVFIGVGFVCLISIFVWFLYHYITKFYDAQFIFFIYFKIYLKPALQGIGLAVFIQMIYFFIIGYLFLHKFMSYRLQQYFCDQNNKDCLQSTIWDYFTLETANSELSNLRKMRFGVILIQCGFYLVLVSINLIINPKKNDKITEIFDNNIWEINLWQKGNFCWIWCLYLIFELYRIFFSFTKLFGDNVWYFLAIYKFQGILLELFLIKYLKDELLLLIFSTNLGLIESLTTAGAADLIDFLKGFLIGLGILMVERIYAGYIIDFLLKITGKFLKQLLNFFKTLFKADDYDNIGQNDIIKEAKQQEIDMDDKKSIDSDFSDILISEQDYKENIEHNFFEALKQSKIQTNLNQSDIQKNQNKRRQNQSSFNRSQLQFDSKEEIQIKNKSTYNSKNNKKDQKKQEEINDENKIIKYENNNDFSGELDKYAMYCNQTVCLFYLPFSFWIIWGFYDEINIAPSWGIKEKDFLYYFLFAVVTIPFQVIMDILFFNIEHYFNGLDFSNAMKYWQKSFRQRKQTWIGFDDHIDEENIAASKRLLYRQRYSSQLYFVLTLGTSSIIICLYGLMGIINSKFNPFQDPYLFFIMLINYILLELLKNLCLFIRRKLKLWDPIEIKKQFSDRYNTQKTFLNQMKKTNIIQRDHLKIKNLKIIKRKQFKKTKQKFLLEKIKKEFFNDKKYQDEFFKKNKDNLMYKLDKIFSPETVRKNKELINDKLKNIYGSLKLKEQNFVKQKKNISLSIIQREQLKSKKNEKVKQMLLIWLQRSQKITTTIRQVGRLIEKQTLKNCKFCNTNWGLRCEPIENIEDIFIQFQQTKLYKDNTYALFDWQDYFLENANFRTICYDCSNKINLNQCNNNQSLYNN